MRDVKKQDMTQRISLKDVTDAEDACLLLKSNFILYSLALCTSGDENSGSKEKDIDNSFLCPMPH